MPSHAHTQKWSSLPERYIIQAGLLLSHANAAPLKDHSLIIHRGRIEGIVPNAKIPQTHNEFILDAKDYLIIPGLINAHTHVAMSFFRGYGVDAPSGTPDSSMIENFLFPAERALTPELTETLSLGYIAQGIKSGVTTFFDHYYFSEAIGRSIQRFGCRAYLAETIADLGGAFPGIKSWETARTLIDNWPFDSEMIRPMLGPHATDTVSETMLKEIAQFAKNRDLPIHIHMSQTEGERTRVLSQYKKTPVEFAKECGILGDTTLAVHLVSATEKDFDSIRDTGTTVAYCPSSQMIYEKTASYSTMLNKKIPVAIASDCAASNDACNILQDCKIAALMARHLTQNTVVPSGEQLFQSVTTTPAKLLKREHELGGLYEKGLADCVFIKKNLAWAPFDKVVNNLIYSDLTPFVEHVLINGKWVLLNRELQQINETEALREFNTALSKLTSVIRK